jgi:hypothetical protein
LSSREVARLVSHLQQSPRWEHENCLRLPLDILDDRRAPRFQRQHSGARQTFGNLIGALEKSDAAVKATLKESTIFDAMQRNAIVGAVDASLSLLSRLTQTLTTKPDLGNHPSAKFGNHAC